MKPHFLPHTMRNAYPILHTNKSWMKNLKNRNTLFTNNFIQQHSPCERKNHWPQIM
jgi:hypothetical protein